MILARPSFGRKRIAKARDFIFPSVSFVFRGMPNRMFCSCGAAFFEPERCACIHRTKPHHWYALIWPGGRVEAAWSIRIPNGMVIDPCPPKLRAKTYCKSTISHFPERFIRCSWHAESDVLLVRGGVFRARALCVHTSDQASPLVCFDLVRWTDGSSMVNTHPHWYGD